MPEHEQNPDLKILELSLKVFESRRKNDPLLDAICTALEKQAKNFGNAYDLRGARHFLYSFYNITLKAPQYRTMAIKRF